jgi:hypothetical protein
VGAAFPKIGEEDEVVVEEVVADAKDEIEDIDGPLGTLAREMAVGLGHSEFQKIKSVELRAIQGVCCGGDLVEKVEVAITEIRPLCD